MENLGTNIKRSREAQGLTQLDLARELSVSVTWVSHVEAGRKVPSLTRVAELARLLSITVDALLGDEVCEECGGTGVLLYREEGTLDEWESVRCWCQP